MDRSPDLLKLAVACEVGDETMVKTLLAAHPDLARSLTDAERRRLPIAAQNNDTRAVRLMLAAGWLVDVRDRQGATPLALGRLARQRRDDASASRTQAAARGGRR